jgi:hypothetical protein
MRRFVRRLLLELSIAAVLALALVLFAAGPAQAAQAALGSGIWDLARHITGAVARAQPTSDHLPRVLAAILLLAVMSSSGSRRRDRW